MNNINVKDVAGVIQIHNCCICIVLVFRSSLLEAYDSVVMSKGKIYLLLSGTTALSLVTTPLMFKLIPAVMHLGVLMHWFPAESNMQNEDKATVPEAYSRAL